MPAGVELQIVNALTTVIQSIGWIGIMLIMTVESANIPIPSEITMPLAGWLLVQKTGGTALQAILLGGTLGALGCLIGSVINYGIGLYGGRPFVERYGKYILISKKDIARADQWFARWGDWASFISRLLPVVRTFISFPAGMVRINFVRFAIFTFVGSFLWCAALALGGFIMGDNWEALRGAMRPFDYPIIALTLIGLVYYIYRHIRHAREDVEEAPAAAE
ncbi:MAG TPA: DedA family protein [Aggregatilineales bacterium]|nr:DedA family protein [Aggregatilineales bacterium]